jgi:large subunit ribosomal protein L35
MLRLRPHAPLARACLWARANSSVAAPVSAKAAAKEEPAAPAPADAVSASAPAPSGAAPASAKTVAKAEPASPVSADVVSASAPTTEGAADAPKDTRGRRRPVKPARRPPALRPDASGTGWNRPLAPGVLPVYDEALQFLRADSRALQAELEGVQKQLAQLPDAERDAEQARKLREKAHILEVQSEVNLPNVRWKFRNGSGACKSLG